MKKKKTQEKEQIRKIGLKNYIILALIFIVVTLITLYLSSVYKVYEQSKREIPVIRGTLSEITTEEVEHYISENPTIMLYVCTASDSKCRSFEKDLKKLVKREELQEELVYLNITQEEKETFHESFNEKYKSRFKLKSNYPAIIVFDEGKVTHMLQEKENKKLSITKTSQFIELHRIGE